MPDPVDAPSVTSEVNVTLLENSRATSAMVDPVDKIGITVSQKVFKY